MNNINRDVFFDDICKLILVKYEKDNRGVRQEKSEAREVFCMKKSVSRNEFYKAGQMGLQLSLVICIDFEEYNNEQEVEYNGEKYAVTRVYENNGVIELYLNKKVGVV